MPRYKMIALTNPVEGREDEFNEWYQNVHLPEVCATPGVVGAQRYRMAVPLQDPSGLGKKYLAVYDIETDDLRATLGAFAASPRTPSDAADNPSSYTVIFEEFGERVEG
ncbi:DUF4286 family protein [Novosphingobium sp. TH158]|uniref:DUF4286 family protein n=1 Tax=Novosphingobium sp. TH158 TaxID=2067455 RepID=UPI000C7DEE48|nr:DUF4286 family protein [Novosphingobium sp. TH158]PLK26292.1 hypothetical protein C0V78_04870 [Novosphingobium sp. TH158]